MTVMMKNRTKGVSFGLMQNYFSLSVRSYFNPISIVRRFCHFSITHIGTHHFRLLASNCFIFWFCKTGEHFPPQNTLVTILYILGSKPNREMLKVDQLGKAHIICENFLSEKYCILKKYIACLKHYEKGYRGGGVSKE